MDKREEGARRGVHVMQKLSEHGKSGEREEESRRKEGRKGEIKRKNWRDSGGSKSVYVEKKKKKKIMTMRIERRGWR